MSIMRAIAFHVAYYGIALIKLPITLIVALSLSIEKVFMATMARIAKWYGDEAIIEGVNLGCELTADGMDTMAEIYLDMKIES